MILGSRPLVAATPHRPQHRRQSHTTGLNTLPPCPPSLPQPGTGCPLPRFPAPAGSLRSRTMSFHSSSSLCARLRSCSSLRSASARNELEGVTADRLVALVEMGRVSSTDFMLRKISSTIQSCCRPIATSAVGRSVLVRNTPCRRSGLLLDLLHVDLEALAGALDEAW